MNTRALVLTAALLVASAGAGAAQDPWVVYSDISYDLDSPPEFPSGPEHNQLDLYVPDPLPEDPAPVVVWVHGGGWIRGDKANQMGHKVPLFTGAGYVFASINYRLSPDPPAPVVPGRVMHPDHVHDVGEAIAWLHRNVASFGGDPERILLAGHSSGSHLVALVSTAPKHLEAYDVDPSVVRAVVALDAALYDIPADQAEFPIDDGEPNTGAPVAIVLQWNALGNPIEEQIESRWADGSPIVWADPADPPMLFVTQSGDDRRRVRNEAMAAALGQDPAASVMYVDRTHAQINGDPADPTGMTGRVMEFFATHATP